MHHPDNDLSINPSGNESIRDVLDRVDPTRRRFMKGTLGTAMLAAFGGSTLVAGLKSAYAASPAPMGGIGFASVPPSLAPVWDGVTVPAGYSVKILSAWGDPTGVPGGIQLDPTMPQTEANQLKQDGMNHDGMHFFPFPSTGAGGVSNERGLLCLNHEYTDEGILHNEVVAGPMTIAKARVSQAAHGVSVKELRKIGGNWTVQRPSPFARRITANTPMKMSGPAAGSALLKSKKYNITPAGSIDTGTLNDGYTAYGTANNCAHGFTPWGTYLTCEENWNGYFGNTAPASDPNFVASGSNFVPNVATATGKSYNRYGVSVSGFGYRWHTVDPRMDVSANPLEPNLFGWVVEIDPWNPNSVPVKRTALGRFKHEGAWPAVGPDNSVAFYQGDDERNDYIYKFVCAGKFNPRNRAANRDLLDSGTLYVAKFNSDLTGQWIPLVWNQNGLTPANGFADQAEVLVNTRQAADRVGATMMDRPEWIAVHPTTNEVYVTLTNNNRRGTNTPSSNNPNGTTAGGGARPAIDAANPRPVNLYGHILRWRETGGNVASTTFEWDIFVECGDRLDVTPTQRGNINGDDFGAPDGLWFDKDGRLWIQTDQQGDALGDWVNIGANSMLCADPSTGEIKRFLTSPRNCEVTGVVSTPDGKTMFVNIQHPGEDWSGSFTQRSTWPDSGVNGSTALSGGPVVKPRAATLVITKDDGGVIGAVTAR